MVPDALICSSRRCLLCIHLPVSNWTSPLQLHGRVHLPCCRHIQGSLTGWREYSVPIWAKLAQNTQACTTLCVPVPTLPPTSLGGWTKLRCGPMGPIYSWDNSINVPEETGCCRRTSELPGRKCIAQVWQFGAISYIIYICLFSSWNRNILLCLAALWKHIHVHI